MTGAEAIIRCLEAEGVTDVFGLPGGAILPLYDAWAEHEHTIRHYLVRHEQGAGHMAQGYARATGKVGVAIATSGPGATNLVTPIADAYLDSTPIVCITGQVPTHLIGTDAFQEADIQGITMPIVKHSWLVKDVARAAAGVQGGVPRRPLRPARPGADRRPEGRPARDVRVLLPAPDRHARATSRRGTATPSRSSPPPRRCSRPSGRCSTSAAARSPPSVDPAQLIRVAEALQMPVVTTLMAKGVFPDSHPLCLGLPGMHGSKAANWAMQPGRPAGRVRRRASTTA